MADGPHKYLPVFISEASEHLATAAAMYEEMDMRVRPEPARTDGPSSKRLEAFMRREARRARGKKPLSRVSEPARTTTS